MNPSALLRFAIELSISVIAPPLCAACGSGAALRDVFCAPCARTLIARPVAPSAQRGESASLFVYGGAIARAIVRFKYEAHPELARPLADLLRRGAAHLGGFAPDVVVPVPLHSARLVERGFNQAALLAGPIARDLGAHVDARALMRVRDTPRQAKLDREGRLSNVRRAFEVRDPRGMNGARVLLVDDVRTTGATASACEEALTAAGVREVRSLVLASADA